MANEIRNTSQYFESGLLPVRIMSETVEGKPERHSHTFYELVLVRGGFGYHVSNNQAKFVIAGSVAAVAPGVVHTFMGAQGLELTSCIFTPELTLTLDRTLRDLPLLRGLFRPGGVMELAPLNNVRQSSVLSLLSQLEAETTNRENAWESAARSLLVYLLVFLARCDIKTQSAQSVDALMPFVGKTVQYIQENYNRDINSMDMSDYSGLSYDYLIRVFKKATGLSPAEYLRNYRIGKALSLLQQTEMPISDIAAQVGVPDVSVFSRQFRKINGITPSEARKDKTGIYFDADY